MHAVPFFFFEEKMHAVCLPIESDIALGPI